MCIIRDCNVGDYSPYQIQDGVFGATFEKNGESLFLRMELLSRENGKCWSRFKSMSEKIANPFGDGIFSELLISAGENNHPSYEEREEITGFTKEEYIAFTEKAIELKKTNEKIVKLISSNAVGSSYMHAYYHPLNKERYIVYISKNDKFSIQEAHIHMGEEINLKKYMESYGDILIAMGSDFSEEDSFHNRGIFRNPYWVFEQKYAGLSMLLHGFSGVVAENYFLEKKIMKVSPVGSMQCIIQKNLFPGEGYIKNDDNEEIDLVNLKFSLNTGQYPENRIKVSALTRIYNTAINNF
ncbi:MAG: hypothetical protein V4494_07800 [Chlamydiota bacterium]